MTPLEWLGARPEPYAVAHEFGHLSVGLSLGLSEGGLEWIRHPVSEIARAYWSRDPKNIEANLQRILGGRYCQEYFRPGSIGNGLNKKLLDLTLFETPNCLDREGKTIKDMSINGLIGDWEDILKTSACIGLSQPDQLILLAKAHRNLAKLVSEKRYRLFFAELLTDFDEWLCTFDENLPYSSQLFYNSGRSKSVFNRTYQAS